jgi:hypothetical protein
MTTTAATKEPKSVPTAQPSPLVHFFLLIFYLSAHFPLQISASSCLFCLPNFSTLALRAADSTAVARTDTGGDREGDCRPCRYCEGGSRFLLLAS